ncbi:MAG: prolipoprotein diacylglyceryl transferase family protein [Patescibacteria group bacterium]|jgi:phosphatidylglycerol:prolipoprotein diacylglycerol transferase
MIPYFSWSEFSIFGLTIYVWGILVSLGFLAGIFASYFYAKKKGINATLILESGFWIILAGIIGGRLGQILYEPSLLMHPFELVQIWTGGMSFFGGLIGASGALLLFLWKRHTLTWETIDVFAFGLPVGEMIGRIGCFLIHDHPGGETSFFLGVLYPDGVVRFDHGLLLVLSSAVLAVIFFIFRKKMFRPGSMFAFWALWEGCVRFLLDFDRVLDVRYWGLTPGQYLAMALAILGILIIFKDKFIKKYE